MRVSAAHSSASEPVNFRASAAARPSASVKPVVGSMAMVRMRSGVSWATASMSMPPSVETTMATRPLARSTSIER